jgi:hypothetical protein
MRIALIGILLALAAGITAFSTANYALFDRADAPLLATATAAAWLAVAAAFLLLRAVRTRAAVVLVIAGSLAIGGAALVGPPNLSTDSARYAWDGIVQNAGISPYAHPPTASALDEFRPAWLYPAPVTGSNGSQECVGLRIEKTATTPGGELLCTALNRPRVPTIYPPVAEFWFAAVRFFVPIGAEYWPMQLAGGLLSLAITGMLLLAMRARRMDPRWAAFWGWSPFVAAEAVNNSHVDALGVVFMLAATLIAAPAVGRRLALGPRAKPLLVGVGIGLAAAVKFVPAIGAPPLLRRAPLRVIAAAAVTFAVVYIPYVLATGWSVLGYLPGYLSEEGYDSGERFALISLVVHGPATTVVAAGLLVAAIAVAWWRADPEHPWIAQTALIGTALLIVSPSYAWYALVLIPFIALSRRWEWLAVPLALGARTFFPSLWLTRTAVATAAILVILAAILRWRSHRPAGSESARILIESGGH